MSELSDLFSLVGAIFSGGGEIICRDELENGLIVSTIRSTDLGLETGILDSEGAHPVERYKTMQEALQGHKYWMNLASKLKDGDQITEIGYKSLVDDKLITIRL